LEVARMSGKGIVRGGRNGKTGLLAKQGPTGAEQGGWEPWDFGKTRKNGGVGFGAGTGKEFGDNTTKGVKSGNRRLEGGGCYYERRKDQRSTGKHIKIVRDHGGRAWPTRGLHSGWGEGSGKETKKKKRLSF